MKIKVCGMKYTENITRVALLEPDYLGFIFYERSPRNFTGTIPELPKGLKKTGVFVNSPVRNVLNVIKKHALDVVQLHGQETAEECLALQENSAVEIWKVFSVGEDFNFASLSAYENKVSAFLMDTKGEEKGGTGKKFNWEVLKNYPSKIPFILSGGIGPDDWEAIKNLKRNGLPLIAVDVNSRFELSPGLKNTDELHSFIKQIKA